jgi:hypothetical protein
MMLDPRVRRTVDRHARLLAQQPSSYVRRRWAVVTSVNLSPTGPDAPWPSIDLLMGGADVPGVRYLSGYNPSVGDLVAVELVGEDPFVTGTPA